MADIDKLLQLSLFIDDITDIVRELMKDDKVSLKDLLNKNLYSETLDLVKWKGFFEQNFAEMKEEAKDLSAQETIQLYSALMGSVEKLYTELKKAHHQEG